MDFNPRSREGSDSAKSVNVTLSIEFQSTLPRGERQTQIVDQEISTIISIHAPARGATQYQPSKLFFLLRFQSTLPRGERRISVVLMSAASLFQSTLPRGERHDNMQYLCNEYNISIHAPARGATFYGNGKPVYEKSDFNPRSREGSDQIGENHRVHATKFQSTLPRGERQYGLRWS